MAIRTGRDKRRNARAHRMTGDHRDRIAQHDSKDVPRFAPNFTVYVLPSKVVCLYSEDRKFFLHGELYCALTSAIGEGRKSFRELVRALERNFPSDKIHEALKPGPVTGDRGEKSPEMSCPHSIDRRAGCSRARRRLEGAGRSRR